MFRVQSAQQDALSTILHDNFVSVTARHIKTQFRNELSRHGLIRDVKRLVERGVEEALAYGITGSKDVRLYIECMVILQPDFATAPTFPWAQEILRASGPSGTEKMNRLSDHLVFGVLAGKLEP